MAEAKKKGPTISSSSVDASPVEGVHPAVPVEKGADWAGNKEYKDNPDAEPSAIAQLEVVPEDK